jgi:hypothetical protein
MGLKGYRLWVMVQLDSTCSAPPRRTFPFHESSGDTSSIARTAPAVASALSNSAAFPVVALQVAFERQILKPVFHLIGFRLWVRKAIGYGLWVNLIQPAEPHPVANRQPATM